MLNLSSVVKTSSKLRLSKKAKQFHAERKARRKYKPQKLHVLTDKESLAIEQLYNSIIPAEEDPIRIGLVEANSVILMHRSKTARIRAANDSERKNPTRKIARSKSWRSQRLHAAPKKHVCEEMMGSLKKTSKRRSRRQASRGGEFTCTERETDIANQLISDAVEKWVRTQDPSIVLGVNVVCDSLNTISYHIDLAGVYDPYYPCEDSLLYMNSQLVPIPSVLLGHRVSIRGGKISINGVVVYDSTAISPAFIQSDDIRVLIDRGKTEYDIMIEERCANTLEGETNSVRVF